MTKFGKLLLTVILITVLAVLIFFLQRKPISNVNDTLPLSELGVEKMEIIPKDSLLGNKDDLVSFSIWPNTKVSGIKSYRGIIKGGYFFEANIMINILDVDKKLIKASNAVATTDWMTIEAVEFEGNIDFTGLPKGPAYFEIHNDNASGLSENDKSILIPIIIE